MPKIQRQLRWEIRSETNPEVHKYFVLIINSPREILRIEQRMKETLRPTDEHHLITEGFIGGLRYKAVSFDSYIQSPLEINWETIYRGKVVRDRNLGLRAAADGLANYIDLTVSRISPKSQPKPRKTKQTKTHF